MFLCLFRVDLKYVISVKRCEYIIKELMVNMIYTVLCVLDLLYKLSFKAHCLSSQADIAVYKK